MKTLNDQLLYSERTWYYVKSEIGVSYFCTEIKKGKGKKEREKKESLSNQSLSENVHFKELCMIILKQTLFLRPGLATFDWLICTYC